ncbi:MAG: PP2C family protein-serine/threonine phosphatase [Phycisphaeraceae bacterium]|nr:PP2C family protein-serine/threonine phosphatase [Phycisphaeraceae bacterium]
MPEAPVESNLRIAILLEMLEEVSRATEPEQAVQAYSARIGRIRPIDGVVSASVRNLPPGQFKITRLGRVLEPGGPFRHRIIDPWKNWERLPVRSGGFLGGLIAAEEPRIISPLDLHDDPVLGSDFADMRSCLAIPIFDGGKVLNWVFQFKRDADGFSATDLEQQLLSVNLFGSMTKNLVSIDQIRKLNDRLQQQFEEVARVQQALLPKANPHIPGLVFATSYLTSEQAGGDYYDFFELPGGKWGILIADVAGHGPGAATVMAMLHAILHGHPGLADGPARVLAYANDRLAAAEMERSFVTAFFAVYDPATRVLSYSRAGHPPPRIKDTRSGDVSILDGDAGIPLGISAGERFAQHDVALRVGQTVVLYTDGVTEAFNAHREMFGTEGLDAALRKCTGEPDCVVDSVHAALFQHTNSRTRDDDQTLVVLKVIEPEGKSAA